MHSNRTLCVANGCHTTELCIVRSARRLVWLGACLQVSQRQGGPYYTPSRWTLLHKHPASWSLQAQTWQVRRTCRRFTRRVLPPAHSARECVRCTDSIIHGAPRAYRTARRPIIPGLLPPRLQSGRQAAQGAQEDCAQHMCHPSRASCMPSCSCGRFFYMVTVFYWYSSPTES